MIDRRQIKAAARGRMAQAQPSYWMVMLVWVLAGALLPQLVLALAGGSQDTLQDLSQLLEGGIDPDLALRALRLSSGQLAAVWLLDMALIIYMTVLEFGLTVYTLRLWRGQPCGVSELFAGFSMVGRVLAQQVLIWLIASGCVILACIPLTLTAVYMAAGNRLLGALLLSVTAWAAAFFLVAVMLSYVLAATALADRPELEAMGAVQYGKVLMRGNKGKFVVFGLSFLGWALLCALPSALFAVLSTVSTLAVPPMAANLIGLALMLPYHLWLRPYMLTAMAGFYDALQQEKGTVPRILPL